MTRVSTEHGWLVLESFVFILGQLSTGHVHIWRWIAQGYSKGQARPKAIFSWAAPRSFEP